MKSLEEFWPFYLQQHRDPVSRRLHFAGTGSALGLLGASVALGRPGLALLALPAGYAFAWTGHLVFEGNRPATWGHPFWSLRADLRMFAWMLLRRRF